MKNLLGTLSLTLVLGMTAVPVAGQEGGKAPAAATPTQAAPAQPPSPPPDNPPPPPVSAQPPAAPAPAPQPATTGQWVYTSQYRLGVDALRQSVHLCAHRRIHA